LDEGHPEASGKQPIGHQLITDDTGDRGCIGQKSGVSEGFASPADDG
jgi:hypothetical protein